MPQQFLLTAHEGIFSAVGREGQQRESPVKAKHAERVHYQVGAPMERIAVDIIGPLPVSRRGNRFVMVVGDYITRWTECCPIPDHCAPTVVTKLVEEFVAGFGVLLKLLRPGMRVWVVSLESSVFNTGDYQNADHTLPSLVRQDDRKIQLNHWKHAQSLDQDQDQSQTDWDKHLALLMMAYRSFEHETTKETPNAMMLGHEVSTPVDLLVGVPEEYTVNTTYAQKLQDRHQCGWVRRCGKVHRCALHECKSRTD